MTTFKRAFQWDKIRDIDAKNIAGDKSSDVVAWITMLDVHLYLMCPPASAILKEDGLIQQISKAFERTYTPAPHIFNLSDHIRGIKRMLASDTSDYEVAENIDKKIASMRRELAGLPSSSDKPLPPWCIMETAELALYQMQTLSIGFLGAVSKGLYGTIRGMRTLLQVYRFIE
jgi:hypothetical protein